MAERSGVAWQHHIKWLLSSTHESNDAQQEMNITLSTEARDLSRMEVGTACEGLQLRGAKDSSRCNAVCHQRCTGRH